MRTPSASLRLRPFAAGLLTVVQNLRHRVDLALPAAGLTAPGGRHDGACKLQAPSTAPEIFRPRHGAGNFPPPSGQGFRPAGVPTVAVVATCHHRRTWPPRKHRRGGACDGGAKLASPCDLGFRPSFPVVVNHDHRTSRDPRTPRQGPVRWCRFGTTVSRLL